MLLSQSHKQIKSSYSALSSFSVLYFTQKNRFPSNFCSSSTSNTLHELISHKGKWTNDILVEYNFFHPRKPLEICPVLFSQYSFFAFTTFSIFHLSAVCYQNSLCVMFMTMNSEKRKCTQREIFYKYNPLCGGILIPRGSVSFYMCFPRIYERIR